LRAAKV